MRKKIPGNKRFPQILGRQKVDAGLVNHTARQKNNHQCAHKIEISVIYKLIPSSLTHPNTDLRKTEDLRF